MANELNVKCNFTAVFAQFHTVEDLKAIANNICAQVKTAYEARVAEINNTKKGVVVDVEVSATPAQAPQSKGSKISAAKEAAAKMKKQAATPAPKAAAPATESADDTLIAITDTAAIKKLGLTFEKYNDRCWVLRGDTKPLRKILKEQFKGVFNSHLSGGEGWVIKTANVEECAKALGLKLSKAA